MRLADTQFVSRPIQIDGWDINYYKTYLGSIDLVGLMYSITDISEK